MLVCSLDWEVVTERRRVNFLIQTARGAAVRAEQYAKIIRLRLTLTDIMISLSHLRGNGNFCIKLSQKETT